MSRLIKTKCNILGPVIYILPLISTEFQRRHVSKFPILTAMIMWMMDVGSNDMLLVFQSLGAKHNAARMMRMVESMIDKGTATIRSLYFGLTGPQNRNVSEIFATTGCRGTCAGSEA